MVQTTDRGVDGNRMELVVSEPAREALESVVGAELAHANLSQAFSDALTTPSVARASELGRLAAASGIDVGHLYTDVIRPALTQAALGAGDAIQLAGDISLTVLADALETESAPPGRGTGRAARVFHGDTPLQSLDGRALSAFLSWAGWRVSRMRPESTGPARSDLDCGGAIELAVLVVESEAPGAALAPLCTTLRRVADPPVIVLADMAGGLRHRAALLGLGVDDVVGEPMALLRAASSGSPMPGRRRWGVRMLRCGDTLTVAPTGSLDGENVGRLADIAITRAGSFRRLVLDLRDLSDIDADGIDGLRQWPERVLSGEISRELLVDDAVRRALHAVEFAGWALIEAAA